MKTNNNNLSSLIKMVINEDLAKAKDNISEKLNEKLAESMGSRFEEYAPTIFEAKKHKKSKKAKKDWDGDGKVESDKDEVWGSRKKAANKEGKWLDEETYCEDGDCGKMEDSEDVEEGEEQYPEEEEGGSENEDGQEMEEEESSDEEDEEENG
jgi:hypothetical protein